MVGVKYNFVYIHTHIYIHIQACMCVLCVCVYVSVSESLYTWYVCLCIFCLIFFVYAYIDVCIYKYNSLNYVDQLADMQCECGERMWVEVADAAGTRGMGAVGGGGDAVYYS